VQLILLVKRRHQNYATTNLHLPTLHCTVIGLTRERFVALGLPSWTHLRTRYWDVLHCREFEDLLRAIGVRYCESWGI